LHATGVSSAGSAVVDLALVALAVFSFAFGNTLARVLTSGSGSAVIGLAATSRTSSGLANAALFTAWVDTTGGASGS
jgi:hypothetical protein